MENREIALKLWNMLGTLPKMQFAHGFDPERFPEPSEIPPFKEPTVTGREVEAMWNKAGKPSVSMKFENMEPKELLGRVVKIHQSHGGIQFSFVHAVTKFTFHAFNFPSKFGLNGSAKNSDTWHPTWCELSTRQEWAAFNVEMKAKRERNNLVNAIIDLLQRKDDLAPSVDQLKDAAKTLGLTEL